MRLVRDPAKIRPAAAALRRRAKGLGFVPTMGFLHEGHLSLVRRARRENGAVAVSIFVNPAQFGRGEDFARYPRDLGRDLGLLRRAGADLVFAPPARAIYPEGFETRVVPGSLAAPLCGRFRPGHFEGVAIVVTKLLGLVRPDALYLGQKDYQQYRVLERVTGDLDMGVRVRMCPIVREPDGLAMSSRNVRLTARERLRAPALYAALRAAAAEVRAGERDARALCRRALARVVRAARPRRIDYLEVRDARTLEPVVRLKPGSRVVLALAVHLGRTRLIDNVLIKA